MFYLIRDNQVAAAETFSRAAARVAAGWELTTKAHYTAWRKERDELRMQQLIEAAAQRAPLHERTIRA